MLGAHGRCSGTDQQTWESLQGNAVSHSSIDTVKLTNHRYRVRDRFYNRVDAAVRDECFGSLVCEECDLRYPSVGTNVDAVIVHDVSRIADALTIQTPHNAIVAKSTMYSFALHIRY